MIVMTSRIRLKSVSHKMITVKLRKLQSVKTLLIVPAYATYSLLQSDV